MRTDEKNLEYLQLLDAYGGLLTEHQRDVCELYYMYDLSLTEIAEQKGVSKQSVSDTLAKSRALLDEYEKKLHYNEINRKDSLKLSAMLTRTLRALEELEEKHPELSEEIGRIVSLMDINGDTVMTVATRGNQK